MNGRKTGGRCKGTPNKRTSSLVERLLEKMKADPIAHMARVMLDEKADPRLTIGYNDEAGQPQGVVLEIGKKHVKRNRLVLQAEDLELREPRVQSCCEVRQNAASVHRARFYLAGFPGLIPRNDRLPDCGTHKEH